MKNQEQPPQKEKAPQEGDEQIIDGVKYRYTKSRYTLRQYYSHSTPEMGPGPGWDFRKALLDNETSIKKFGRTFTPKEVYSNTSALPDIPLFFWEEVFQEE